MPGDPSSSLGPGKRKKKSGSDVFLVYAGSWTLRFSTFNWEGKMRVASIIFGMAFLIIPVAEASQIIQYNSEIPVQDTDWNGTLHIQQFDPLLGELSSAMIFVSAGYDGLVEIVNNEDSEGNFTWATNFTMDLQLPGSAIASNLNLLSDSHYLSGTVAAGETVDYPISQEISDLQILEGEPLAAFIGTGMVDLPTWTDTFSHLQIYFFDGSIDFSATAWAQLTVTYVFNSEVAAQSDTWSLLKTIY